MQNNDKKGPRVLPAKGLAYRPAHEEDSWRTMLERENFQLLLFLVAAATDLQSMDGWQHVDPRPKVLDRVPMPCWERCFGDFFKRNLDFKR